MSYSEEIYGREKCWKCFHYLNNKCPILNKHKCEKTYDPYCVYFIEGEEIPRSKWWCRFGFHKWKYGEITRDDSGMSKHNISCECGERK
jgi:hypothetical protein